MVAKVNFCTVIYRLAAKFNFCSNIISQCNQSLSKCS